MLTKEPEMLQPDTFCEHTTQQNATAAGEPAGETYSTPPEFLAGLRPGAASQQEGNGGKEKGGKLDQRRRMAKAGHGGDGPCLTHFNS